MFRVGGVSLLLAKDGLKPVGTFLVVGKDGPKPVGHSWLWWCESV